MFDRLPTLQLGAPRDKISFSDLHAIANRFKKHHHFKREHIRRTLNPLQRQFLDALPLILDMNDPELPGFISSATPAGIFAYRPDKQAIEAARQINSGFNYRSSRRDTDKTAIDGLFLMGSAGSIAFTITSDMDIWLCHRGDLTEQEFDELQKKTRTLENWAASLHLEVHFFLINSRQFLLDQKKPVSVDSSGETQHYLLLEEFYRTSVYIAGKALAWWLVPPEHENNYQNYLAHLLEHRLIEANQVLDLGGLAHIPAHEFISATQWHIYKALHSPYKSLVKLSLTECYASEYPNINWLCVEIKRSIYQGEFTGPGVDPYVLIYRRLEDYLLKSQNTERLALIRQFFYRKANEPDESDGQTGTFSSYEDYFRDIFASWKWPNNLPDVPTKQNACNMENLLAENIEIVSQLSLCYSKIIFFTYDHIDSEFKQNSDMKLLARKLNAFFERKPGKIEIITASGNQFPIKPNLSIIEDRSNPETPEWGLFFEKKDPHDVKIQTPLYRQQTLIEILSWLTVNNFYREGASIRCDAESLDLTSKELSTILGQLDAFFKNHFDFSNSLDNYADHNSLTHSLLIINIGLTLQPPEAGAYSLTHRDNPLSFGASRESLVRTIDRISISHWNEVLSSHGEGIEGLCHCLVDIINKTRETDASYPLTVICHTPGHDLSIIRRIEKLFADLLGLRHSDSANSTPRYLMAGAGGFFVFSKQNDCLQYQRADNEAQLIEVLRGPRKHYGSVMFDVEVLALTPIPTIYRQNRAHVVQCFVQRQDGGASVYVLDENGSLYIRHHQEGTASQLISHYARFLHSLLSRKTTEAASMQFYEIENDESTGWSCRPISFHLSIEHDPNPLIIEAGADSATALTVRWNGAEFTSQQYGDRLFETVSERIIEFRKNRQNYPVYITDLDLSSSRFGITDSDRLQTLHFLESKEKIEARLNGQQ
ncbi:MAG: class I adenylate cyclase [Methylomicrobium sp.]